ncbi:MAG: Rrf2 family transcriptional regulator [Candidatus Omnitrophica bacterium]|nr:Rrf2 family transcriptional regulator [Candidatus Omnitrophota bacterium]
MKLITRDTDYAIRALCCMAKSDNELVSVSDLCNKLRIPRPFLRKILQILNKKKILRSIKGQNGGFKLNISSRRITLFSLIVAFQGNFKFNECTFKKSVCPEIKKCKIRKKINKIERYVVKQLKNISILSLVAERG